MYFLRRLRPLEVVGERVRSLRVSLNAPVLTTADLPAGPARAMVVVHQDARGRMDATVGARSVVSGETAYWSFDGELQSSADVSVAADAALTFAESLGFLFDEGALSGPAAEKAFRAWAEGQPDGASPLQPRGEPAASRASAGTTELAELELEELVPEEEPEAEPAKPAVESAPSAVPAPRLAHALSKFRARPSTAGAATQRKALRQPLARVQLVKRRSPEDERKLALRRLITSF
jgi:hypothetical protein